jgi:3-oxochol-4-en-24-oyl-CoA dehydrogenase
VAVMAAALTIEQSVGEFYIMSLKYLLREALSWSQRDEKGWRAYDRPAVRAALAEAATRLTIQELLSKRCIWAQEKGETKKHFGPMTKLFCSESWLSCSQHLLELSAADGLLTGEQGAGIIEYMARRSIPSTIYAGTSEIQRSIIAESVLEQPRSRN